MNKVNMKLSSFYYEQLPRYVKFYGREESSSIHTDSRRLQNIKLHLVAYQGDVRLLTAILDDGIEVDLMDTNQDTALFYAINGGSVDASRLLLERGASLEHCSRVMPPFHLALQRQDIQLLELLKEYGADINETNKNQETPLQPAAQDCSLKIVKWLVENGADINLLQAQHWSKQAQAKPSKGIGYCREDALIVLAANENVSLCKLLLDSGASPDGNPNRPESPLSEINMHHTEGVVRLLVKYGASLIFDDPKKKDPITLLLSKKRMLMMHIIQSYPKTIQHACRDGIRGLLHRSTLKKLQDLCPWLLQSGVDADPADEDGITPLMLATSQKNMMLCQLLVNYGADIHKKDHNGWTPLVYAARQRSVNLAQLFVDQRASIPSDIAEEYSDWFKKKFRSCPESDDDESTLSWIWPPERHEMQSFVVSSID
ncbi:ankyrin repeat-containing domain protein [Gorgonomyces haynaldii]|nr:ankyrin repeat-containing domain protein [Gorgonomyces haynaldii]